MITKNMIDAGLKAYLEADETDDYRMLESIYEAMSEQKQKDALVEYRERGKTLDEIIDQAQRTNCELLP